jgi:hypothetical protein
MLDALAEHGYVIVHPDDVLDWIERLSENPLGTPIYSTLTPGEAAADFMERFAAAEEQTPPCQVCHWTPHQHSTDEDADTCPMCFCTSCGGIAARLAAAEEQTNE